MKNKKLISLIIILMIFNYILLSLMPMFSNKVYAADQAAGTLSRDINGIDDNLYPGYKSLIKDLQSKHSNYTFLLYYTGIDWDSVINIEYQGHSRSPKNLVQITDNYNGMWICPICGTQKYDNGKWCCASREALAYMMDPRNSLNEEDVFQFKDLEGSDVAYEDIARVVSGYGSYINNNEVIQAIVDASKEYNINGYFLVSKIINEHGKDGSTLSAGQGHNGQYVGYYNYFNIGSYGNGKDTIIYNGLSHAKGQNWNTRRASILGGAKEVRESYITKYSQNTLYYQKFNVSGRSTIGSHQYQQNIMAAQSQGESLKEYYGTSTTPQEFVFIIPLYKNMPKQAAGRPDVTKANSITYKDGVVKNISTHLTVRAQAGTSKLAIGKLDNGEEIKILQQGDKKIDGYYWDLIVSKINGTYGYAARNVNGESIGLVGLEGTSSGSKYENNVNTNTTVPDNTVNNNTVNNNTVNNNTTGGNNTTVVEKVKITTDGKYLQTIPELTVESLNAEYKDKKVEIKDNEGNVVKEGNFGTGYKVTIEDKTYTIVKKGDINGDADIDVVDYVYLYNYLNGKLKLENEFKDAAALMQDIEDISVVDYVALYNYLKGTYKVGL